MGNVLGFLSGKKTYICAIAAATVVGLNLAGVMDQSTTDTLLALLGFGGIASLRSALGKRTAG